MAAPSYTYTLTNGTTADASQVMQNFNDVLNGITDGTKDLSISALTCAGTATLNGHVNLGNSSADDLTVTASLASSLPIKTNNSFDIGSATLGLRKLYLGNGGAGATCDIVSASHATTREYTIPDCGAAASFVMTQGTQTISGTKTFDGQLIGKGTATNDSAAAGYIGEFLQQSRVRSSASAMTTATPMNVTATALTLTAGDWVVSASVGVDPAATTVITDFLAAVTTTSATVPATNILCVPTSNTAYVENNYPAGYVPVNDISIVIPGFQVSISGTTTFYLVAQAAFSASTAAVYGSIWARRVR